MADTAVTYVTYGRYAVRREKNASFFRASISPDDDALPQGRVRRLDTMYKNVNIQHNVTFGSLQMAAQPGPDPLSVSHEP